MEATSFAPGRALALRPPRPKGHGFRLPEMGIPSRQQETFQSKG